MLIKFVVAFTALCHKEAESCE